MELEDGNSGLAKVPENELLRRAVEIGRHRVGRGNIPFVWPENRTDVAQLEHANDCLARALQTETDGVRVLQDPGQARSDGFGALVRRRTKGENTESMSFYVIEDNLVRDVLSVIGAAIGVVMEPWTGVPSGLRSLQEVFRHFITIRRTNGQEGLIKVYEAMLAAAGGPEGDWPSAEDMASGQLQNKGEAEVLDALIQLKQLGVVEAAHPLRDGDHIRDVRTRWKPRL